MMLSEYEEHLWNLGPTQSEGFRLETGANSLNSTTNLFEESKILLPIFRRKLTNCKVMYFSICTTSLSDLLFLSSTRTQQTQLLITVWIWCFWGTDFRETKFPHTDLSLLWHRSPMNYPSPTHIYLSIAFTEVPPKILSSFGTNKRPPTFPHLSYTPPSSFPLPCFYSVNIFNISRSPTHEWGEFF